MNWIKCSIIFLGLLLLWNCSSNAKQESGKANVWISGRIEGTGGQTLYLEGISAEGIQDLAQIEIEENGEFLLPASVESMGLFQLRLGQSDTQVIPLTLVPGDKVKLNATEANFASQPNFSGTDWSKPLSEYMRKFDEFAKKQTQFAQNAGAQATQEEAIKHYTELRKPLDAYALSKMQTQPENPVNIILVTALAPSLGYENWDSTHLEIYEKVLKAVHKKYPESNGAYNLQNQYNQVKSGYLAFLDYQKSNKTGAESPEISLPNPEGKQVKLSDLRGKYVLIDFWASWCGPCRRENPNVVKLYDRFKDKGFTVFSVSLDQDAEKWKMAIAQDNLKWPYHVSDLKAWDTPMTRLYNFNSIPHTVLLDKQGKVIATNLRGAALEQKLEELL